MSTNASAIPADAPHPYVVGQSYIVRTVSYHVVGRLTWVGSQEIVLEDAAWVADSGRWNQALLTGKLEEVEPFVDPVVIGRGTIGDCTAWRHPLPRDVR